MTPESDFHIYLTSRSSLDNYPRNHSSKFTNRLNPTIIFNNIQEWEVGLASLILPFQVEKLEFSSDIEYNITIKKKWFEKISPNSNDVQFYDLDKTVTLFPSDLVGLGSKRIYNIIVKKLAASIDIKSNILETYFLTFEKDYLIINSHFQKKPVHEDIKDLLFLKIHFNVHTKNVFGFDNNSFILYDVQDQPMVNQFIGNKKINLNINHPNFILVYTDIVTTSQYGSQNITLLDVLPFGESYTNNRKNNTITYKNISSNIINDISIILTDPSHDILNTYSEDCVICLHFRRKKM